MIPQIIHYTWFSGEPFPELIQKCIASWHKYMPEYEYVLWDKLRLDKEFPDGYPVWLEESLRTRKWAFASDYIRAYAVYKYGGVYLDTDCVVYRSFCDVLNNRMFIGREYRPYITFEDKVEVYLTSHSFGAEQNHPFLKLNLEYYKNRRFITCSSPSVPNALRYDMLMLPFIQGKLAELYGYDANAASDRIQKLKDGIIVYPSKYFGLYGDVKTASYSYVRHLGVGGWREPHTKKNIVYNWKYKIHWRIIVLLRIIAKRFNCVVIEL